MIVENDVQWGAMVSTQHGTRVSTRKYLRIEVMAPEGSRSAATFVGDGDLC